MSSIGCAWVVTVSRLHSRFFTTSLLALALILFSGIASAVQLLPAPLGFEGAASAAAACPDRYPQIAGTIGPGWHDNTCWRDINSAVTYTHDTVNPRSGTYSQRIEHHFQEMQIASDTVRLVAGKSYTAKIWMRADSAVTVTFALQQATPNYPFLGSTEVTLTSEWREYSFSLTAPSTLDAFLVVRSSTPGRFWLDDATLDETVPPPEMLSNPGFEGAAYAVDGCPGKSVSGNVANGWHENSCWASGGATISYAHDTANPHGGSSSQRVNLGSGTMQIRTPFFEFPGGKTYTGRVWLRAQSPMTVTFALQDVNAPWTRYGTQTITVGTSWAQHSFTTPVPAMTGILLLESSSAGTLWVDDASLQEATAPTPPPRDPNEALPNPTFEGTASAVTACTSGKSVTGSVIEGWFDNSCWVSGGAIAYAPDNANLHSGTSAQRAQVSGGGLMQFRSPDLALAANNTYTGKIWLRASASMSVKVALQDANPPYARYGETTVTVGTEWTQHTFTASTPTITGMFLVETSSNGTFWMDDASLVYQVSTPPPAGRIVPPAFFGMHVPRQTIDGWPTVPFAIQRLWDLYPNVTMLDVNPQPGVYQWDMLDTIVNDAERHGVELVYVFGYVPEWASTRDKDNDPPCPEDMPAGACYPPQMQAWKDFVTQITSRYGARIKYWELWNEPNESNYWRGSLQQLVALAREAYPLIKNAGGTVLSPAPQGTSSPVWLDRYFNEGGDDYLDVIAFHGYLYDKPEALKAWMEALRTVRGNYGLSNKPFWDTEHSWGDATWPMGASQDLRSAWLARFIVLSFNYGIERSIWYAWDNPGWGTLYPRGGGTMLPPGKAYEQVYNWLVGASLGACEEIAGGNMRECRLMRANGYEGTIVWHTTDDPNVTANYTVPPGYVRRRTLDPAIEPDSTVSGGQTIAVGMKPVLFEK